MSDESAATETTTSFEPGMAVYDDENNEIGVISELTDEGFEVSAEDDPQTLDREDDPGQEFGEGYIMWRCENCGEMGELEDGLPSECPSCDSENVHKTRED
jgi:rubrerythrin